MYAKPCSVLTHPRQKFPNGTSPVVNGTSDKKFISHMALRFKVVTWSCNPCIILHGRWADGSEFPSVKKYKGLNTIDSAHSTIMINQLQAGSSRWKLLAISSG